jgi:hypothetical protein
MTVLNTYPIEASTLNPGIATPGLLALALVAFAAPSAALAQGGFTTSRLTGMAGAGVGTGGNNADKRVYGAGGHRGGCVNNCYC